MGALVDVKASEGRTPLVLAVLACVDSYRMERRSPESVQAFLQTGVTVSGIKFPAGYANVDELLQRHGAK